MPKNKKKSDTETESQTDTDSGPDDRNAPPPKKAKETEKKAPTKTIEKNVGEKVTNWSLEKLRQVNINEFRGRQMIDIREFYEKDGKTLPGKKGISLSIPQWKKLLEIAEEINANLD